MKAVTMVERRITSIDHSVVGLTLGAHGAPVKSDVAALRCDAVRRCYIPRTELVKFSSNRFVPNILHRCVSRNSIRESIDPFYRIAVKGAHRIILKSPGTETL